MDFYHSLFSTPHFPFFFIIQTLWISYNLRSHCKNFPWWKSFSITFFMALSGRVLVAYFCNRSPPLFQQPAYPFLTFIIWSIVYYSKFLFIIIQTPFFQFIFQILIGLINVRESLHGFNLGLRSFPRSPTGAIFISLILSSTESLIWMLFSDPIRTFSSRVVLRNCFISTVFFIFTQYPESYRDYFVIEEPNLMFYLLCMVLILVLLDNLIFGIRSKNSIDITLLTYITSFFTFHGANTI